MVHRDHNPALQVRRQICVRNRCARRLQFQSQRIQSNKCCRITLFVSRSVGFHGGNARIVKALRTFAAGDDNVALVQLQPNDTSHVTLRFGDEHLERFAFGRKPKAVENELAVFRKEGVARLHSQSAATTAAGESSPTCSGRSRHQVQS